MKMLTCLPTGKGRVSDLCNTVVAERSHHETDQGEREGLVKTERGGARIQKSSTPREDKGRFEIEKNSPDKDSEGIPLGNGKWEVWDGVSADRDQKTTRRRDPGDHGKEGIGTNNILVTMDLSKKEKSKKKVNFCQK